MATRSFNLRLWFAAGSLGMIVVICSLAAYGASVYLTSSLLELESQVSQEFLENIVAVDGPEVFDDSSTGPYSPNEHLLDFTRHIMHMQGILRVNVHGTTRRLLWSTNKQLIGQIFRDNDELEVAFAGERIAELGSLPDDKEEHQGLGDSGQFIEAYIPIRADAGKGAVIGVVELYKRPNALEDIVNTGNRYIVIAAALAALLLFSTLYWIVQRGALIIEGQQLNLRRMEAFAAIGQMASAVAHSLRNPMAAVRSSAELFRHELPESERQTADDVIREIDRMDSYVRDLLAYARTEPAQIQSVDPGAVMDRALSKLGRIMELNRIVPVRLDRRTAGEKVSGDARLLEQALISLLTNAIEAMPDGGHLGIAIGPSLDSDMVRIIIADSGAGIDESLMDKVSQSYFTTKVRGLGLGLVLARSIVERFGGAMSLTSKKGVGTRVLIDLRPAA